MLRRCGAASDARADVREHRRVRSYRSASIGSGQIGMISHCYIVDVPGRSGCHPAYHDFDGMSRKRQPIAKAMVTHGHIEAAWGRCEIRIGRQVGRSITLAADAIGPLNSFWSGTHIARFCPSIGRPAGRVHVETGRTTVLQYSLADRVRSSSSHRGGARTWD